MVQYSFCAQTVQVHSRNGNITDLDTEDLVAINVI
jgi:hypothetical protein